MLYSNIFRSLDDDLYQPMWPIHHHQRRRPNVWSSSIDLNGFEPSEIQIKEDKNDKGLVKIIVHAKHEEGDDLTELKKAVKVPSNVDNEKLRTVFNKDGVLILRAPYKETSHQSIQPHRINREDSWNGIWGEMERLNEHLQSMVDTNGSLKFPRTEFVANEGGDDGVWRVHINIGKGFKQEDVQLRNINNCIKLEAKKEVKSDHGISSRHVSEMVSIPEGVEQDKLKSKLFDNGDLILEAPCIKLPSIAANAEGKVIPIETAKSADSEKMAVDN